MSNIKIQGNAGGTGTTTLQSGNTNTSFSLALPVADGTNGQALVTNGSGVLSFATSGTGDVAGPASAVDSALAAFDATTGKLIKNASLTANNVLLGNGTGAPLFVAPSTAGNVLTSNGTTWTSVAGATGDVTTNTVQTLTGTKTFSGTSSTLAMVINDVAEVVTASATAATGTINYDITTQSVLYYTSNSSANWTVNFRASSGTSLNTAMSTGQSVTVAFLVTNGATAYYNNVVQVDGTTITPKFQGGTAYTTGNANSIDVYMYTIIKTASATFTILASQTKFA